MIESIEKLPVQKIGDKQVPNYPQAVEEDTYLLHIVFFAFGGQLHWRGVGQEAPETAEIIGVGAIRIAEVEEWGNWEPVALVLPEPELNLKEWQIAANEIVLGSARGKWAATCRWPDCAEV